MTSSSFAETNSVLIKRSPELILRTYAYANMQCEGNKKDRISRAFRSAYIINRFHFSAHRLLYSHSYVFLYNRPRFTSRLIHLRCLQFFNPFRHESLYITRKISILIIFIISLYICFFIKRAHVSLLNKFKILSLMTISVT